MCRTTLLGASVGFLVGLVEAACMRLTDIPLFLQKPHVTAVFWFLAPLLTLVAFGTLGLLTSFLAGWIPNRYIGMVLNVMVVGLAGAYLGSVLEFSQQASPWFIVMKRYLTPEIQLCALLAWTLLAFVATRKQGFQFGALERIPLRSWARVASAVLAILVTGTAVGTLYHPAETSKADAATAVPGPNIILIVWDTTRADHVSSYGYHRQTTPYADQLARRGVLFENATSASSWTLPSMASMFTSLLPHQHGASADIPLGGGPRTLAEILASRGYETAGFNANTYFGLSEWGLAQGFQTYVDGRGTFGYNLDASVLGRDIVQHYGNQWFGIIRSNMVSAEYINQQVYGWLGHRSNRPYFLFVNYMDAHGPYQVPAPYNQLYGQSDKRASDRVETAKLGRVRIPPAQREGLISGYDNCLHYMDAQLGDLLRFLSGTPEWSNTYVIFTSDHGEAFGEHGIYGHGWDLHREALRVPLIIAGPGVPTGVRVSDVVQTRRLFSTVLEMAGLRGPLFERTSLSRFWIPGYQVDNPDEPTLSEVIDATEGPSPQGMISVTTREWQLIYRAGQQRSQLYHWPTDPVEQQDVAEQPGNQAIVDHLKSALISTVERSNGPWRDPRYLLALSQPGILSLIGAHHPRQATPGAPLLSPGAGAVQLLFPQDPETPKAEKPDEDLLRSLPYGEAGP